MGKPVVAVTPLYDIDRKSIWMFPNYLDVVSHCGALPIIVPFARTAAEVGELLDLVDGVLLTGGHDIDPALYHERKIDQCGPTSESRDMLELELFAQALERNMPIFGICRGMQMINVALGGTLWQDLTTQRRGSSDHRSVPPQKYARHYINVVPDTPLHNLFGVHAMNVNSYHHQGIKDLSPKLDIMAYAQDGLAEAVYMPSQTFVWGVQWHPERAWRETQYERKLIWTFTDACKAYAQQKRQ